MLSWKYTAKTSELAKALIPVESKNNIKIKTTCHKVTGDRCILEGILLMNACRDSQSSINF